MALILAEANRIVQGAIAEAGKRNARISVTVCNTEGRLIALNRMDGAVAEASRGSIGKAIAAASSGKRSDTSQASVDNVPLRTGTVIWEGMPIDRRRGGLAIIRNGQLEGGCGVEGTGNGEQDEACAYAGLATMGGGS